MVRRAPAESAVVKSSLKPRLCPRISGSQHVGKAPAISKGDRVKKTLLYAAGFLEVILCAGGIMGLLKVPPTMLRMGVRPVENPDYFSGMVAANVAVIALMVWLIILTRRKLNSMK